MSNKLKAKNAAQKRKAAVEKIKRLTKAVILEGIIIAALVIAFIIHIGFDNGSLTIAKAGKMTMEDYSTITISSDDVEVTDDEVETELSSFTESLAEESTDGIVEDGDTVTITYTGYYDEDGEKGDTFDSDEDYSLTIGSDTFIDGFEDGLIGASIGDTVDLSLTFPEDYETDETMAGVDAIFEVEITSKTVTPDLTDELVAENSEDYYGTACETVEELEDYIYEDYYNSYLESAVLSALTELQAVTEYNSSYYDAIYADSLESIEYYGELYGYEADEMAAMYGYDTAEEYAEDYAEYYTAQIMLIEYIYKHEASLTAPTESEIDDAITEYMEENGYSDSYDSVDDFTEAMGDAWYLNYTKVEMRMDDLIEALSDNIVISDGTESSDATEEDTAE